MAKLFRQRKGQSAIEYLTTYGWMLLVIAIVGGAIFTTVQGNTNVQSSSGFTGEDIQVENFGLDNNDDLQIEFRSQASGQVTLEEVTLYDDNGNSNSTAPATDIGVGETSTVTLTGVGSGDTSDTFDLEVRYDAGELNNLTINGTITGEYQVE